MCDFNLKLDAILSLNADITFLIDIRAHSSKFDVISNYIECTKQGNFKIIFNSDSSQKRGVAILYKETLDLIVTDYIRSPDHNILLINARLKGQPVTLGAIYGPTDLEDENFFINLKQQLCDFGHPTFLIGGDFNAVTCTTKPSISYLSQNKKRQKYENSNPEILNMQEIPNPKHSAQICDLIAEGFWVDPFRILNYNLKEFSYVPKQYGARNRSRIDFFLTSQDLLGVISKVEYLPTITNFDHKTCSITMMLNNSIKPPLIDHNLLSIQGILEISRRESLLLLLLHGDIITQGIVSQYSQVTKQICELTVFVRERNCKDKFLQNFISQLQDNADTLLATLPFSLQDLFDQDINIRPALFLETLQNNIKINIVNYQKLYKKAENKSLDSLKTKLNGLKTDPSSSCDEIFQLEQDFSELMDEKITRICKKSRSRRALHLEKASRAFCSLAKTKKKQESISAIKDTSDPLSHKAFNEQSDRSKYISNFYKKIYTKGSAINHNIEEFLGPDISNSDYVLRKKLTNDQRESLESDITLNELDESIKNSNKFSAPGRDGWSFGSVSYLWDIFRVPLKNAFNSMTNSCSLEFSFKDVSVRLIPKKGDLSEIKNWRPISLLSVFYKIPASSFAKRLRLFLDQIVSVRQKAYSSSKVIQECVMSVIDNISKCLVNQSNAALILVDFTKAFDRVSHDFVSSVLEFFNFGPKMMQIAKTLLTGRHGSIITEAGLSPSFAFNSGTGQGAPESCYFFIIALEILLIKLKLCPSIERVIIPLPDNDFETLEGAGFADDLTEIIMATKQNLVNLKLILDSFFRLSDLEVNMSKTVVVPVAQADTQEFRNIIISEGLSFDKSFKILGFKLTNDLKSLDDNLSEIIEKITRIFAFWDKYKLTLPGRVMVFKTYVLSCIGYICQIIPTPPSRTNLIDKMVYRFVTKNVNIKEELAFRPNNQGGLGLIRSSHFIQALRVGIFRRSLFSNDTWSMALKNARKGTDPFWINCSTPLLILNPSAKLIAHSINFFVYAYLRTNGNFVFSPIFDNLPLLRMPNGNPLTFADITNHDLSADQKIFLNDIRLGNCVDNGGYCVDMNAAELILNTQLSRVQYFTFRNFINHNVRVIHANIGKKRLNLISFFQKIKKGSRHFRNILVQDRLEWRENEALGRRLVTINTYLDQDAPILTHDKARDSNFQASWNKHFIWHYMQENFIKYIGNRLQFNNQLAKRNPLLHSTCSICRANNARNIAQENIFHIILSCRFFKPVVDDFVANVKKIDNDFCNFNILTGKRCRSLHITETLNILCLIFINYVYIYRNKIPPPTIASMNLYISRCLTDFSNVSNRFGRSLHLIRNTAGNHDISFLSNNVLSFS